MCYDHYCGVVVIPNHMIMIAYSITTFSNHMLKIASQNLWLSLYSRARTNVATFECLFVFVTFVSRFFVIKHLIVSKLCVTYV